MFFFAPAPPGVPGTGPDCHFPFKMQGFGPLLARTRGGNIFLMFRLASCTIGIVSFPPPPIGPGPEPDLGPIWVLNLLRTDQASGPNCRAEGPGNWDSVFRFRAQACQNPARDPALGRVGVLIGGRGHSWLLSGRATLLSRGQRCKHDRWIRQPVGSQSGLREWAGPV